MPLTVNMTGKLFFTACAAWLVGRAVTAKSNRRSRNQTNVLVEALLSSQRFMNELERPGASVDSVFKKLQIDRLSVKQFEELLRIPWPL